MDGDNAKVGVTGGTMTLIDNTTGKSMELPVLEARLRDFAAAHGVKLGAVAQPLRAALTGSLASPGIFEMMEVLGREESLGRVADAAKAAG